MDGAFAVHVREPVEDTAQDVPRSSRCEAFIILQVLAHVNFEEVEHEADAYKGSSLLP